MTMPDQPDSIDELIAAVTPTPRQRAVLDAVARRRDACATCGAQRDPDTGYCPHTDAACDERAGLREDVTAPELPPLAFE